MMNLTFGEQVKIILGRKGMTIKELAEQVEKHTGKPMSRQNMTQRLGRDNFQEQDMRMIAEILGCQFSLSIMDPCEDANQAENVLQDEASGLEREITVGELVEMTEEVCESQLEDELVDEEVQKIEVPEEMNKETVVWEEASAKEEERNILRKGIKGYFKKTTPVVEKQEDELAVVGDINPYTGKEYQSNSVRIHPKRIGYVQVYDQEQHKWTDMTEWAFLGYQERKKKLLGKDYRPPIYLD